ncbi:MAG: hypothetical protein J7501_16065 [Bdellovibrio sp.]|nr:hypothetical protein [Bdellovibrio sp.]
MKTTYKNTFVALSLIMASSASFASGLNLQAVQSCIQQEQEMVVKVHPMKARFIMEEREGSVADLVMMMKENREVAKTLTVSEKSRAAVLNHEFTQMKTLLESSNDCAEARKASFKFVKDNEKISVIGNAVFFEVNDKNADELVQWTTEAKKSLRDAGYSKAEATLDAVKHPAMTILLASGETTSVLDQQFAFDRDTTMRTALRTMVGHDAPATVLEDRLVAKMRKEMLAKMDSISKAAKEMIRN